MREKTVGNLPTALHRRCHRSGYLACICSHRRRQRHRQWIRPRGFLYSTPGGFRQSVAADRRTGVSALDANRDRREEDPARSGADA